MNNERIQEIIDRNLCIDLVRLKKPQSLVSQLSEDITYLLSEVERLQEENKKLQATLEIIGDSAEKYIIDRAT